MSSTYAGTNTYSPTITLPSDGDPGNAASVNVPFSGLADRTTYLKGQTDTAVANVLALQMSQAMNFRFLPQVNVQAAVWDAKFGAMWAGVVSGTTPQMRYTFVPGTNVASAATTDVISGIATPGDVPSDIAVDTNGNVVMACVNRYIYRYNPTTSATQLVQVTASLTTTAPGLNGIVFDPITNRFIWVAYTSTTPVASYSTDQGATWSGLVSIAGTIGVGAINRLATSKLGTTLMVRGLSTGATIGVYRTTNGGTSWSGSLAAITSTNITAGVTVLDVSYCSDISTWFIVTGGNSSVNSEVWASTDDGVTWTLKKLFTGCRIYRIASLGPLLVSTIGPYVQFGGNSQSFIAFSTDGGTTWRNGGVNTTSTASGTSLGCKTGEGFIYSVSSHPSDPLAGLYVGHRFGTQPISGTIFT